MSTVAFGHIFYRRNFMSWKVILRLAELAISAILATSLFLAWRAEREDRSKLAVQLATAQQSLTQAPTANSLATPISSAP